MATIHAISIPSDPFAALRSISVQNETLLDPPALSRSVGNLTAVWNPHTDPSVPNLMGTILCRAFGLIGSTETCSGEVLLAGRTPDGSRLPTSLGPVLESLILGCSAP